jgi:hypothetical protein
LDAEHTSEAVIGNFGKCRLRVVHSTADGKPADISPLQWPSGPKCPCTCRAYAINRGERGRKSALSIHSWVFCRVMQHVMVVLASVMYQPVRHKPTQRCALRDGYAFFHWLSFELPKPPRQLNTLFFCDILSFLGGGSSGPESFHHIVLAKKVAILFSFCLLFFVSETDQRKKKRWTSQGKMSSI